MKIVQRDAIYLHMMLRICFPSTAEGRGTAIKPFVTGRYTWDSQKGGLGTFACYHFKTIILFHITMGRRRERSGIETYPGFQF